MTVTYTHEVATCRGLGCFPKLLFRWRGSIYKIVWIDLCVFLVIYYILHLSYNYLLDAEGKRVFEVAVNYCNSYGALIPLSFVLGFYVSLVMARWWQQYVTIPWPDPIAVYVSAHVQGNDDRARVMRRTVMRYVCLCLTMVMTMISPRVKKRFPTYGHLVEAGLMQESERWNIERLDEPFPNYPKHWMPIVWASSIIMRARKEGKIRDDYASKSIIDELNKFRGMCGFLLYYDWVSVPLVYTQVVTLAVYSFFLCNVIGQQWIDQPKSKNYNSFLIFFPIFSILEFFFYMGWLKVAETLINPFGDDDDDFELNWMIDRNLQVSYLIVDEMYQEYPELTRDQYWEDVVPSEIPYADENQRQEPPEASTTRLERTIMGGQSRSTISVSTVDSGKRDKDKEKGKEASSKKLQFASSRSSEDTDKDQFPLVTPYLSEFSLLNEQSMENAEGAAGVNQPVDGDAIPIIPDSLNFDELIEQRKREREERIRNRFLNLRTVRYSPPTSRPDGEEEEQQEQEEESNPN